MRRSEWAWHFGVDRSLSIVGLLQIHRLEVEKLWNGLVVDWSMYWHHWIRFVALGKLTGTIFHGLVDVWALVACGSGVDENWRAAGLKRFWDAVDVLAGPGGLLGCFFLTPLPKRKYSFSVVT